MIKSRTIATIFILTILAGCRNSGSLVAEEAVPVSVIDRDAVTIGFSVNRSDIKNLPTETPREFFAAITVSPVGEVQEQIVEPTYYRGHADVQVVRRLKRRISSADRNRVVAAVSRLVLPSPGSRAMPLGCSDFVFDAPGYGRIDVKSNDGTMRSFLLQSSCDTDSGREARKMLQSIVRITSRSDFSHSTLFVD